MVDNSSGAMNYAFKLMADARCRIVLEYLRHRVDDPVSADSLVRYVVKTETDGWDGAVPPEYPDAVAGDLKHAVLPDLVRHGIIEHDSSTGTIWYRGNDLIDTTLRLAAPMLSA